MPVISTYMMDTYNKSLRAFLDEADIQWTSIDTSRTVSELNIYLTRTLPEECRKVIHAWPDLPTHVKDTILTLVENAKG